MNYIKIAFGFLILLAVKNTEVKAQDPGFTQFYANQLYLNPAFAGTSKCPRIVMNYRNQWPAMSGTFVTYGLAYDQYISAIGGGVGLLLTRDDAGKGIYTTTRASFTYSKHIALNSQYTLNFGLEGGVHMKNLNPENLVFGDQISSTQGFLGSQTLDPAGSSGTGIVRPDFSAGALLYSKYFFMGLAGHHLNTPDEGFVQESTLPIKYTGHMGASIPLRGNLGGRAKGAKSSISPNVLYQRQQDFQQLNLGLYVKKGALVSGLWYRNSDAFIVLIGIEQDMIKLGYSYDLTISRLGNASAGSHELSFQWQFPCRPPRKKLRAIQCPSF
ncbi:type IX secretion system membrane protein PorP/SprF [Flavobacteriales bacterium]|jgi:type IX secretion system PorP/SprF family membrane protein|nr:type IX secretion system membrane protein PorP/SprF [Flavobacteriales bacterium]